MKPAKILILNQGTIDPSYEDIKKASYNTWQTIKHPHVKVINYYGSADSHDRQVQYNSTLSELTIGVGDMVDLYTDENENSYEFDSRGEKFILALEYCLNNFEFDYIYRISCTSYINIFKMYDYINSLSREKVYNGCYNMHNYQYLFVSGFHSILSRDMVEHLVNNKNKFLQIKYPEDVATGIILIDYLKIIENFESQDQSFSTYYFMNNIKNSLSLLSSKAFNYKVEKNFYNNFYEIHEHLLSNDLRYFYHKDLLDNYHYCTDKGNVHDYINSYYGIEFNDIKHNNIKLVEIGIACGNSMRLWRRWFTNAEIFGLDIMPCGESEYIKIPGVTSIYQDAYNESTINMFENESIDYLIDDGPHNVQSQKDAIIKWYPKIKKGGKIIVEDITHLEWAEEIVEEIKRKGINVDCKIIDIRENVGRYDDIIIEATKLN